MASESTNKKDKVIEGKLSYKIVGILYEIQNELGRHCRERQYGDVLEKKLLDKKIRFNREFPIKTGDRNSNFVDFNIEGILFIDLKAKPFITKEDYHQMKRYLEISGTELGLVVNFRQQYLKPKRILNAKYLKDLGHSDTFVDLDYKKGFTLVELLVVIGLIIATSAVSFIFILNYRQMRDVQFTIQEITTILRSAQNRSVSQEEGSRWGVHFENSPTGGFFNLFRGAEYENSSITATTSLRSTIQFNTPGTNNNLNVIFSPISGLPNASATVIISLVSDANTSSSVTINSNGEISY